ncbi:MAG TPA: glycerol-3-phosphate 1-O-acyltransferase PlsY [Gammaproteobacteria bacterium]|jgi:glycerol-3-phosphate acyltransferase PlsY|nr:glycerol-3-phosphate 1-O-acyltransferase PlsY [Gammaproteobacteria bacterium]
MLELGIKFTLAYLLGAVLGSLVVGRLYGGVDIRKVGSGNPGGTNALRTQGKTFALLVMLIDVGKGILAAAVIPPLVLPGIGLDASVERSTVLYASAFAAIVGHVFPVWFAFRGGKGGATAGGLVCFLAPVAGTVMIGSWLLIVLLTGYVGIATVSAAVVAVVVIAFTALPEDPGLFTFACATAALVIFAHRGNLKRMLNGTESRFSRPVFRRLSGGK